MVVVGALYSNTSTICPKSGRGDGMYAKLQVDLDCTIRFPQCLGRFSLKRHVGGVLVNDLYIFESCELIISESSYLVSSAVSKSYMCID